MTSIVKDKVQEPVEEGHEEVAASPALGDDDGVATPERAYAPYPMRLLALLVDIVLPVTVIAALLLLVPVFDKSLWYSVPAAVCSMLVLGYMAWNRVWNQGSTGRTVGKDLYQIVLLGGETAEPLGRRRTLLRELVHVVDTFVLLLGWLRPLWHTQRQTVADSVSGSVVVRAPSSSVDRKAVHLRVLAALTVTLISTGALAGALYFHQHRTDQQVADAQRVATQVASDGTVALLSYAPDTADEQLQQAADLLTGDFATYYRQFTKDVVAPTAVGKGVTTQANVVGVSIERIEPSRATVLVLVNQTTVTAEAPSPAASQSAVRVTIEKSDGRWLISAFDPVL